MRFEDKYVVPLRLSVEGLFNLRRYGFEELYEDRVVNSIYFDDSEFSCFTENLEGNANRTKIRLRWYGEASLFEARKSYLEIKWKESGVGGKNIIPVLERLTEQRLAKLLTDHLVRRSIDEKNYELGKAARMLLVQQEVLKVQYSRKYLFSKLLNCRLTVDSKLCGFPICHEFRGVARRVAADFRVVELKYETPDLYSCRQYANCLEIPRRSFSKYSWGLSHFNGQILANV